MEGPSPESFPDLWVIFMDRRNEGGGWERVWRWERMDLCRERAFLGRLAVRVHT